MQCVNCAKPLRAHLAFCTQCGHPIAALTAKQGAPISPPVPGAPALHGVHTAPGSPTVPIAVARTGASGGVRYMPAVVIGAAVVVVVAVVAMVFSLVPGSSTAAPALPTTTDQVPDAVVTAPATPPQALSDSSTSPTTEPDQPTTQPDQPTDDASAQTALENEVTADRSAAEQLVDQWVPQLSSKRPGLVVNGVDYDYVQIWQNFEQLRAQYPSALLVWSGDYTSFKSADFFVTVVAQPYPDSADANLWCDNASIDANDCYAKLLSHTASPAAATMLRQ